MGLEETCLHRISGECPNFIKEVDFSHYPNNYNCNRHYKVRIMVHEIVEEDYNLSKGEQK
jgi:hypothetical protein